MLRRESEHRNVPYVFLNAISTGLIVPDPKTMEQIPSCCYPPRTCQRRGMCMQAVRKSRTAVGSMLSRCSLNTLLTVSLQHSNQSIKAGSVEGQKPQVENQ